MPSVASQLDVMVKMISAPPWLAAGDVEEFAASCGELARNDALRSVNQTVIANCGRDRREGVRFARVPTGLETCTFCLMLASRGAVYHTRESVGEFSHYHRRCDCKVVPGFADDPMAELVEGHSPMEAREKWQELKQIDENKTASEFVKTALKNRVVGKSGRVGKEPGAHPWKKEYRAAELVTQLGIDVCFIKERPPNKTPDAYLNDKLFEFKIPEGFGEKTVKNQLKSAMGKGTENLLISNVVCNASDDEMRAAIESFLDDDSYKDKFSDIRRIVFVGKLGDLAEYKR